MKSRVPSSELRSRMARFRAAMDLTDPEWALAAVVSKVNLYYFTGTMQDGLLLIPRDGGAVLWVRRSHERALAESRNLVVVQQAAAIIECTVTAP